jgi:hypothetical protein
MFTDCLIIIIFFIALMIFNDSWKDGDENE